MRDHLHHSIPFVCLLTLLLAVTLQSFTRWVPLKPLKGYTEPLEPVECHPSTCLDGSYQAFLADLAKRNTGFRECLIRSYNQVAYTCFNSVTNHNIVKGYDNELFLTMYLDEVTGKSVEEVFQNVKQAEKDIHWKVTKTLRLIDTLKQHDKQFLFVFAPTKTAVYPEKMPKHYQRQVADFNLEETYIELFEEKGIPYIDFYHYFQAIKDTVSYPLYATTGSHWAQATIPWVADSILRKMASLTGYQLPGIQLIDPNPTTQYSDYDSELEGNMNLLFPLRKPAIPNPVFTLRDTAGASRPNLLVVADSYFDQLMFSCFPKAFNRCDFWQYNRTVYSSDGYYKEPIQNVYDAPVTLQEADIVLALFTAPMMYDFMYDFHGRVNQTINLPDKEVMKMMRAIRSTPTWYEAVAKQAEERGITVEENLRRNALYYLENSKNNKTQE